MYRLKIRAHHHVCGAHRRYATKYTAKVTSSSAMGRSLSAEVTPPPPLPSDPRGYDLPRRDLVCKATRILLNQYPPATSLPDPFADLADFLASLSVSLTAGEASEILKSLNSPQLAMKFFQFCPSSSPDFRHDSYTYTRLLLILSKSSSPDRFDLVRSILSEMDRSGVRGTISTVNILIGFFGHTSDLDMCLGLVKKWDLNMNSYTYKCLLQAYLRSYDTMRAFETYREMRRRGYMLDIFAYNMLLDALVKAEKVDHARKIFEDMKKKRCDPDEFTYTIMIRMSGKWGKADEEPLALFQEMVEKGRSPNLMAYNTVIQALARKGMADKAVAVFTKMVEQECRPNEFTFSVILNALVSEGKLGRLDEVLKVSEKFATRSIYAYLVKTLGKLGQSGEAHRVFCSMWGSHERGDREACLAMLESLCSAGKTAEAVDLLGKIHEKGVGPDTVMHNAVLSALGRLKQTSTLHEVFEGMKRDGPQPDVFTYNIVIAGLGRTGHVAEAVAAFEELEERGGPDVVTYNTLINVLGKNGDVGEAHMRYKEMEERGLSADVVTYGTLIECFGKSGRVEQAVRVFEGMVEKGCAPNLVTYNILMDCLESCGKTAEAVDLYARMKEQGLAPDAITYAILDRLQSASRNKGPRLRRRSPITGWVVNSLP